MFGFDDPFGQKDKNAGRDKRRSFTQSQKNEILHQQNNKCAICKKPLDMRAIQYDHKKPWADKGRTVTANGRALHPTCHSIHTHTERVKKADGKSKATKAKKSDNPFDITTPVFKLPKTPKGKGGFGLF